MPRALCAHRISCGVRGRGGRRTYVRRERFGGCDASDEAHLRDQRLLVELFLEVVRVHLGLRERVCRRRVLSGCRGVSWDRRRKKEKGRRTIVPRENGRLNVAQSEMCFLPGVGNSAAVASACGPVRTGKQRARRTPEREKARHRHDLEHLLVALKRAELDRILLSEPRLIGRRANIGCKARDRVRRVSRDGQRVHENTDAAEREEALAARAEFEVLFGRRGVRERVDCVKLGRGGVGELCGVAVRRRARRMRAIRRTKRDAAEQVVLHVRADGGQRKLDIDAELAEHRGVTNSGKLEQLRALERATGIALTPAQTYTSCARTPRRV
jgi:hypothetical protein